MSVKDWNCLFVATFINWISSYFICSIINIATREINSSITPINHAWSNTPKLSYFDEWDCSATDHYPVFILFSIIII